MDTVLLTLKDLAALADTSARNGTSHNFPAVALQWAAGAQAEIDRLRAEVANIKEVEFPNRVKKVADAWKGKVERLEAEVAALREDAERYRWLKTRKSLDLRSDCGEWRRTDGTTFTASHYLAEGGTQHAPAESLDETIDNARKV